MFRVAVVGATGAVGGMMLRVLEERGFPVTELRPLASSRSTGRQLDYLGKPVWAVLPRRALGWERFPTDATRWEFDPS